MCQKNMAKFNLIGFVLLQIPIAGIVRVSGILWDVFIHSPPVQWFFIHFSRNSYSTLVDIDISCSNWYIDARRLKDIAM